MTTTAPLAAPYPLAARTAALAGLLWSLFGAWQFVRQTFTDEAGLIAGGMTPEQAGRQRGGAVGLARGLSDAVGGDALLGVFAVFGTPQVVVLSIVVLVAAGLLWLAQRLAAKGVLA
jgi:hypothetical protein